MISLNTYSKTANISGNASHDYSAFLNHLYNNKPSGDELFFLIKDLDNNGIPELIISKNGTSITIYTLNSKIIEAGKHNFETGTARLFYSDNPSYPGIFFYFAGGGMNHHGYISIRNNKLIYEELWNEDYSGISKELKISRKRIEELSSDRSLINESRKVYKESNDLPFKKLQPGNFHLSLEI